jgi:vitamin B12 transporter
MRTFFIFVCCSIPVVGWAQDSLKTTTLNEVVVTGTKYELSVLRTGKTITKITAADLERNAGKTLGDILNEVPGIQVDGNFSTPGANLSYFVRGARNRNTLVLIDGVPLNDPSGINAEYDLRYIPLTQIESIEVLKGGLSTLYGTGASAGVISIKLKTPESGKVKTDIDLNAGSYSTFGQNINVSGTKGKLSFLASGSNQTSKGFSSAEDKDETVDFDDDGFSRQNVLLKLNHKSSENFSMGGQVAYEQFKADYDAYEFTDADNEQLYHQTRLGLTPTYFYDKGEIAAKLFYNTNYREFKDGFPNVNHGRNVQAEVTQRHIISESIQLLSGVNFQRFAFEQEENISFDSSHFASFDPYTSFLLSHRSGLTIHAGVRLNTHSIYGSKFVYNLNPSYTINANSTTGVRLKIFTSVSTAYITPSLYQLYSVYGNKKLTPEESFNIEGGAALFLSDRFNLSAVYFRRNETDLIDFVPFFDESGNYAGARYENLPKECTIDGLEFSAGYTASQKVNLSATFTSLDLEDNSSSYRIPAKKFGVTVDTKPVEALTVSVKYNFTGERRTFDFNAFEEIVLTDYQLVDLFASYALMDKRLTLYGAINNLLDEKFIGVFGYTTRGRNFNGGVRYRF